MPATSAGPSLTSAAAETAAQAATGHPKWHAPTMRVIEQCLAEAYNDLPHDELVATMNQVNNSHADNSTA